MGTVPESGSPGQGKDGESLVVGGHHVGWQLLWAEEGEVGDEGRAVRKADGSSSLWLEQPPFTQEKPEDEHVVVTVGQESGGAIGVGKVVEMGDKSVSNDVRCCKPANMLETKLGAQCHRTKVDAGMVVQPRGDDDTCEVAADMMEAVDTAVHRISTIAHGTMVVAGGNDEGARWKAGAEVLHIVSSGCPVSHQHIHAVDGTLSVALSFMVKVVSGIVNVQASEAIAALVDKTLCWWQG